MPRNRNNTLSNKHYLICGQSGGGKSTFIQQNAVLQKAKRLLIWDPYHDHACTHRFTTVAAFKRHLSGALRAKKGFRAALSINADPKIMCKKLTEFYDIAWLIADGKNLTYLIVEEIADGYTSIGKAQGRGGQVFRAGRSFGLVIYALTQSTAEIPKTIVKQCGTKVVFYHDMESDLKRAAELVGRRPEDIGNLKIGEHYIRHSGIKESVLKRTRKL